MDHPFPRTFGDHNTPTQPLAPGDPLEEIGFYTIDAGPDDRAAASARDGSGQDNARVGTGRAGRHDGWTPDRRARFCELIADGMTVDSACYGLGKTVSSAYALKRRPDGASFALAWGAANLIARARIADRMLSRALDGQVERVVKPNGDVVERHRFDNRLALHLLTRLDRQAESDGADAAAARLVAQDFDGFVDLVRRDAAPARAGLFLLHARQTDAPDLAPIAALARADAFLRAAPEPGPDEPPLADLEADGRRDWTAEQWRRAEAGGLIVFAPPPPEAGDVEPEENAHEPPLPPLGGQEDEPVWWDDAANAWRTSFPPPDEFDGVEDYPPGHVAYTRALTEAEEALMGPGPDWYDDGELAEQAAARDAWFAPAREGAAVSPPPDGNPCCPAVPGDVAATSPAP